MAASARAQTVNRNIYFYRIQAGVDDAGKALEFDLRPFLSQAFALPFKPGSKRYWVLPDGNAISVWPGDDDKTFSLATLRRSSLPRQEQNGILADLGLSEGAALHEPIHLRLFDQNLIGVEYNFYGPRATRLPAYLQQLGIEVPEFGIEPILRQDAYEQLKAQDGIRAVDFEVRRTYIAQVAESNKDFGKALENFAKLSAAEVVGVVLRPEPRQRSMLSKGIFKVIKKLARRPDLRDNATVFKVRGRDSESGAISEIDLLDDALVSSMEVATTSRSSRAVDATSAFDAIIRSHAKLRDQLVLSPSIGLQDVATSAS